MLGPNRHAKNHRICVAAGRRVLKELPGGPASDICTSSSTAPADMSLVDGFFETEERGLRFDRARGWRHSRWAQAAAALAAVGMPRASERIRVCNHVQSLRLRRNYTRDAHRPLVYTDPRAHETRGPEPHGPLGPRAQKPLGPKRPRAPGPKGSGQGSLGPWTLGPDELCAPAFLAASSSPQRFLYPVHFWVIFAT